MTATTATQQDTKHYAWLRNTSVSLMLLLLVACSASPLSHADPATGTTGAPVEGYMISPEDVLSISVWREPELQREVIVRPDGGISFPLLGNLIAAGKSPSQLEADITKGIAEYVPDAVVTVSVTEIKGLKIFVTGQVKKPGQFLVGRYIDVLQALTLAGGVTPFADRRNIRILRRSNGGEKVFLFDYNAVQRGNALDQNILLKPGDTVVVP